MDDVEQQIGPDGKEVVHGLTLTIVLFFSGWK
jgi:hypothetical protein